MKEHKYIEGHWCDYVVVADGQVVTCGKRYRRIRLG